MYTEFEVTDPSFDEVDRFHYNNFCQGSSPPQPYPGGQGLGMDKETFNNARDQIIRGLLELKTRLQVLSENMPFNIESKTQLPGADNDLYLALYVKGHAYEKVIYCQWIAEVIFYCPKNPHETNKASLIPIVIKEPENFNENRFFEEKNFYYYDKRNKEWNSKKFSEFYKLERFTKSDDTGSNDCNSRRS